MEWSPASQDMNAIENLLPIIERDIYENVNLYSRKVLADTD